MVRRATDAPLGRDTGICVHFAYGGEIVTVEIVAWESCTGVRQTPLPAVPYDEFHMMAYTLNVCCAERFDSDVAQWIACRAHRHSPLPGGSSIETRRRYFLFYFRGSGRNLSLFQDRVESISGYGT